MLVLAPSTFHLRPGLSFHPFQWNRATSLWPTAGQTGTWPALPWLDFLILHHSSCQENTSPASLLGQPYYADPAPVCLHNSIVMKCSDTVLVKKKKKINRKHLQPSLCTSYRGNRPGRICRYPIFEQSVSEGSWTLFCQGSRSTPDR